MTKSNDKEIGQLLANIDHIKDDIQSIWQVIETIKERSHTYDIDMQGLIQQLENIIPQYTNLSIKIKELETELLKKIDERTNSLNETITKHIEIDMNRHRKLENRLDTCEDEREKQNIFKFIKENPWNSIQITIVVIFIVYLIFLTPINDSVLKLIQNWKWF